MSRGSSGKCSFLKRAHGFRLAHSTNQMVDGTVVGDGKIVDVMHTNSEVRLQVVDNHNLSKGDAMLLLKENADVGVFVEVGVVEEYIQPSMVSVVLSRTCPISGSG